MVQAREFFRPSPLLRWTLVPILLAFGLGMPLVEDQWTPERAGLWTFLCGSALLYALALLWPRRFPWAGRVVAFLVFVAYAVYLGHELFFTDKSFELSDRRSASSPGNALEGLLIIGLPALLYALRPRREEPAGDPPTCSDAHVD